MKVFGTDGIRDRVDGPLLEAGFVYRLGRAVGQWMQRQPLPASAHAIIGRDPRASGQALFMSLARGLHAEGVRIFDAGICPTPAVSIAVQSLGLEMGLVITASHNPATDNGIKLFGPGGCKLTVAEEEAVEALVDKIPPPTEEEQRVSPPVRQYEARRHYIDGYQNLLPEQALLGFRIVVDSAHGATAHTSAELLTRMGAQVFCLGNNPDGLNINEGLGSEHPEALSQAVLDFQAHLGIAHDGDGDRVVLCDHNGRLVEGDAVMAILATAWARRGELPGKTVVATVMSNLGLDACLAREEVRLERVGVGDRQVYFAMKAGGYVLGGEASGHFIAMDFLPTGDGLLAALLVLREILMAQKPLADLAASFRPFPQLTKNLAIREKPPLESLPALQEDLARMEQALGARGRLLLRYSGTEPLIRLLAEAEDAPLAESTLARLEALVRAHLTVLPAR